MGWSLVNAFETPTKPNPSGGLVAPSVAAMDAYWGRLCQIYGTDPLVRTAALAVDTDLPLEYLEATQVENLQIWVSAVVEALPV